MKIFGSKSPVDFIHGEKPEVPMVRPPEGSIKRMASRVGPLLDVKCILDKVYSNGYFENHYPDADRTLKGLLHKRAMQAWAQAEHFGSDLNDYDDEKKDKQISLVINIGA
jgi:hypothetical protein